MALAATCAESPICLPLAERAHLNAPQPWGYEALSCAISGLRGLHMWRSDNPTFCISRRRPQVGAREMSKSDPFVNRPGWTRHQRRKAQAEWRKISRLSGDALTVYTALIDAWIVSAGVPPGMTVKTVREAIFELAERGLARIEMTANHADPEHPVGVRVAVDPQAFGQWGQA